MECEAHCDSICYAITVVWIAIGYLYLFLSVLVSRCRTQLFRIRRSYMELLEYCEQGSINPSQTQTGNMSNRLEEEEDNNAIRNEEFSSQSDTDSEHSQLDEYNEPHESPQEHLDTGPSFPVRPFFHYDGETTSSVDIANEESPLPHASAETEERHQVEIPNYFPSRQALLHPLQLGIQFVPSIPNVGLPHLSGLMPNNQYPLDYLSLLQSNNNSLLSPQLGLPINSINSNGILSGLPLIHPVQQQTLSALYPQVLQAELLRRLLETSTAQTLHQHGSHYELPHTNNEGQQPDRIESRQQQVISRDGSFNPNHNSVARRMDPSRHPINETLITVDTPLQLPVVLALPGDDRILSTYQVLLRKQIEAFQAEEEDTILHIRGRNKPIKFGQVGIRCRHCQEKSPDKRKKGSTYYPATILSIYQAAQNMSSSHFNGQEACSSIPRDLRQQLLCAQANKSIGSGSGKQYWAEAARKIGLVDTPEGIRFIRDFVSP